MKKNILLFFLLALIINGLSAQSTTYGIKGGLTMAIQKWNGFQQDPLLKYHGAFFIENGDETTEFALFAQAGYHLKGSAIRNRNFFNPTSGQIFRPSAQQFIFKNTSLVLGAKRKYDFGLSGKVYYMFGLRGDYTLGTNLDEYTEANEQYNTLYFPIDYFVRKFNYGVTIGGGAQFSFGDLVGGLLEVTVNPDFSAQYKQPPIGNVYDPYTGQTRTISERTIRNLTFEVSLGFYFIRRVEYVD